MKKLLIYSLFIIAALLITFFGLGPVAMADGSNTERMMTLLVVLMLYAILAWFFWKLYRKK